MTERLTTIEGPMFSGKTLELIRLAKSLEIGGAKVQFFKPILGERGEGLNKIRTRFGGESEATAVKNPYELIEKLEEGVNVVLIDEIQFMDQKDEDGEYSVVKVIKFLLEKDIKVIVSGLSRDFRREPFGPMPILLALSQEKITLTAVCDEVLEDGSICGQPATETQRFVGGEPANWSDPVVLVGDRSEGYAARCLKHHKVRYKPSENLQIQNKGLI